MPLRPVHDLLLTLALALTLTLTPTLTLKVTPNPNPTPTPKPHQVHDFLCELQQVDAMPVLLMVDGSGL